MWASACVLVVGCWHLDIVATAPIPISVEPIVWNLVRLSCPIVFGSFYFHFGVGIYWVLLANVATYGLVGLIVETLRRQLTHAK
jgi:hypothetical protein